MDTASPASHHLAVEPGTRRLLEGERLLASGRRLGSGGGFGWYREAWRVCRAHVAGAYGFAAGGLVLVFGLLADPRVRIAALLIAPFVFALLAAWARRSLGRPARASLWQEGAAAHVRPLLMLGLSGLAAWLALSLVLQILGPVPAERGLVYLGLNGLARTLVVSSLLFSPFLVTEYGLSPGRALLWSVLGFWKNWLSAVEICVSFVLLAVVLCSPVVLVWAFVFPEVPMSFSTVEWLPAAAGLLLSPLLLTAPYFAYRDIFIEEPPPAELRPLHFQDGSGPE